MLLVKDNYKNHFMSHEIEQITLHQTWPECMTYILIVFQSLTFNTLQVYVMMQVSSNDFLIFSTYFRIKVLKRACQITSKYSKFLFSHSFITFQ